MSDVQCPYCWNPMDVLDWGESQFDVPCEQCGRKFHVVVETEYHYDAEHIDGEGESE